MPLSTLTQTNALAWLLDVRQRLNVSVDLVDDGLMPLLPMSGRRSRNLRGPSLDLEDQQLHPAILGSMRSLRQEAVSVDGVNVVSTPIVGSDGRAAGALLVSDAPATPGPALGSHRELARIGAWLAGAIDAHLANALANHASDFQQLASLQRLLNRVAKSGSEPELVRAFIDAVAVWHDAEAWGYVRDLSDRYLRVVALPGADRMFSPKMIAARHVENDVVVRLTQAQRDELGFEGGGDTLVARVSGRAAAEWLIVVRGHAQQNEARLALYVDVLGRALTAVAGVESSQLTWAMMLHLMQSDDPPEMTAERAIEEVSRSLRAQVSFALFLRETGIFGVGPAADLLAHPVRGESDWLALPVRIPMPYRAAIGVRRDGEMPLTRADEQLLQSAGLTLAFWLNGVVDRLPGDAQRRNPKSFEQVVDERVADTLARGEHVSVIVLSLGSDASLLHVARGWIARIRALLRPSDLTGWLTNDDIGIVLPATPAEAIRIVWDRIAGALLSDAGAMLSPAVSTATRAPGSTSSSSILSDLKAGV